MEAATYLGGGGGDAAEFRAIVEAGRARYWRGQASSGSGNSGLRFADVWRTHFFHYLPNGDEDTRNLLLTHAESARAAALLRHPSLAAELRVCISEVGGAMSRPAWDFDAEDPSGQFVHATEGPTTRLVGLLTDAAFELARLRDGRDVELLVDIVGSAAAAPTRQRYVCATSTRKVAFDGRSVPFRSHLYLPFVMGPKNFSRAILDAALERLEPALASALKLACDYEHSGGTEHKLALIGSCKPNGYHVPYRAWLRSSSSSSGGSRLACTYRCDDGTFAGLAPELDDPAGLLHDVGLSATAGPRRCRATCATCEDLRCFVHRRGETPTIAETLPGLAFAFADPNAREVPCEDDVLEAWYSCWRLRPPYDRADAYSVAPARGAEENAWARLARSCGQRADPHVAVLREHAPETAFRKFVALCDWAAAHEIRRTFEETSLRATIHSSAAAARAIATRKYHLDAHAPCPICKQTSHPVVWTLKIDTNFPVKDKSLVTRCRVRKRDFCSSVQSANSVSIHYLRAAKQLLGRSALLLLNGVGLPGPGGGRVLRRDPCLEAAARATSRSASTRGVAAFVAATLFPHPPEDFANAADESWSGASPTFAVAAALRAARNDADAGRARMHYDALLARVYVSGLPASVPAYASVVL